MDAWTFVNKEARFVKKPLKIVLLVLAAVLLVVMPRWISMPLYPSTSEDTKPCWGIWTWR